MLKLRRYLKPFAVSILAIIVLLFAQAMCELTMPDYMSNIVNVGINANGIEDGVPEAIREQEYEKLSVFMDEQQQQLFEEHYEKVSPSAADSEQTARYPLLSEETLYILEPVDEEQRAALNLALSDAELCVSGVNEMEKTLQEAMDDPQKAEALSAEQQQMLAMMQSMPQGTSLSDVLSQLPQEQIDQIKAERRHGTKQRRYGQCAIYQRRIRGDRHGCGCHPVFLSVYQWCADAGVGAGIRRRCGRCRLPRFADRGRDVAESAPRCLRQGREVFPG